MALLDSAPQNGCEHNLAYETADDHAICYGCGAEWTITQAAAPAATKARKPRAKKSEAPVGTEQTELLADDGDDSVQSADVQDDGEGDEESQPELPVPVQEPQAVASDVPKTSKRGKKAKAPEPTDQDGREYTDAGPMSGTKCPSPTCMNKLEPAYPNIFVNKTATYHYGCKNCEARVTVYLPEGI